MREKFLGSFRMPHALLSVCRITHGKTNSCKPRHLIASHHIISDELVNYKLNLMKEMKEGKTMKCAAV